MINLIVAAIAAVVLSLSTPTVKSGESFKATATVSGPYQGMICVLIGQDASQEVVAESCAPEDVVVKEGEKKDVVFDLHAPVQAPKGSYSFMAVLETETTSEVVKLVIE